MRWLPRHPVTGAGITFLLFAPVEILIGHLVHNSAIASNAAHDAFDGVFFLLFAYADDRLSRARSHRLYCRARHLLSFMAALFAVIAVAVGFALEQTNNDGRTQLVAALVVGPISFALNLYWERRLGHSHGHDHEDHGAHEHHGISVHLLGDMAGAVMVVISSALAYSFARPHFNFLGGEVIILITVIIAFSKMASIVRQMVHSEAEHDHRRESDEIHRAHSPDR